MAGTGGAGDRLFATKWVHVFEEDTAEGAVYRPEEGDIPLSRRPRERLELGQDGSARLFVGGPDDGLVEHAARWRGAGRALATAASGAADVHILEHAPDRLVVKIRGAASKS